MAIKSQSSSVLFWKLATFYAAYFLAFGIYMPYWPLWLDSIGLNPIEIGWILAGTFWIKVIVQPAVTQFVDKKGQTRFLTTTLMFLSCVGFCFIAGVDTFWPVLIIGISTAACYQPVLPVMESVVLRHTNKTDLDYGKIRLWGSVTFIIGTTVAGWLIAQTSMSNFIWILISAMTLVAISCAVAPNQEVKEEGSVQKSKPWTIIVTKPFIIFIISAGLIQISHSVLYGFGTLHWRNLGHSETTIGLFWSIGVLAEIALFALAGKFKERIGPLTLLTAAALAGVIRWLLLAMLENHVALFVTQILHCFTFGAAHLGAMTFLSKTIPNDVFATGQGIYYTLVGGVFSGCMLPVAGFLFTSMAGNAFYFMAILSAFALGGLYLLSRCSYQNLENEH